jgi:Chlorophyll A-B binding protein
MKAATSILAFLLAPACAFVQRAGHREQRHPVSTRVSFEDEIGAQRPLGFFDPLGVLNGADAARFNRLRYVEIKHGRISMLAVLGHVVTTAGVRLPGDVDLSGTAFDSIPTGLAALSAVPSAGLLQIFSFIGFLEIAVMKDIVGGEFVGDFRNNAIDFGWDTFSPEEQERKRGIELNNGRAAMMGILGLMVHEMLPSHDPYVINGLVGYPVDFNAGY